MAQLSICLETKLLRQLSIDQPCFRARPIPIYSQLN